LKKTKFFHLFISLFALIFFGCTQNVNIEQSIKEYCKNNEEIQLKDVTKFDWDIAYIDYQVYGQGDNLKNLYGIEGDFDGLNSEEQYAIAFCKNEKLIEYVICNSFDFIFGESLPTNDKETLVIYPETAFSIEVQTDPLSGSSTFHLFMVQLIKLMSTHILFL